MDRHCTRRQRHRHHDPAQLVPVRIDPELLDSLRSRAARDHATNSEVIRAALREYLAS